MLKKEDIVTIEKSLQLEAGKLQEAISAEKEVEVTLPELVSRTKTDHETYINNLTEATTKSVKKEAQEVTEKRVVREIGKGFEIEMEGIGRTPDSFISEFKKKNPNWSGGDADEKTNKIAELEGDKSALQKNLTEIQNEFNTFKSDTEEAGKQRGMDSFTKSTMPDNLIMSKDQTLILFKSKFSTIDEEGKKICKDMSGNTMKDDKLNALAPDAVMKGWLTDNKFIKEASPGGGNGGGDGTGNSKAGSMDAFIKEMEGKNINSGSADFNLEMHKRIKDKTLTL